MVGVGALVSSVKNNVGALALLMPLALRGRERSSCLLMPLAFATILGGLITVIGTPPNLIVAAARAHATGEAFGMFDFTPVGLAAAGSGGTPPGPAGCRRYPDDRSATAGLVAVYEQIGSFRG